MKKSLFIIISFLFLSITNYSLANGGGGGSFVDPPAGLPNCGIEPHPGQTACTATPICNLNGYCGTTSSSYTVNSWSQLTSGFCGSIENNAFLSFTAESSTISFDAYVYNCGSNEAIQIYLFKANSCSGGSVQSLVCVDEMYAQSTPYNVSASGLVPGDEYYIMIDGYAGDVCDYTFVATGGVATPISADGQSIAIDNDNFTICAGENVVVVADGGWGTYDWSGEGLSTTTGDVVTITPPFMPGVYDYNIESSGQIGLCPGMTLYEFTVTVEDCGCGAPVILLDELMMCQGESVDLVNAINPASDPAAIPSYHNSLTDAENGTNAMTSTVVSTAGPYWIRVEDPDDADCYAIHEVVIEVVVLDFTSSIIDETCGDGNGEVTLTGSGGTAPYTYSIDNGATTQIDNGHFTALSSGTYNVLITDIDGCETTGTVSVANLGTPQVIAPNAIDICVGESVTLTANNPDNAALHWSNGVSDGISFEPPAGSITYTVTATANGCTATDQVTVNVHESPVPIFTADTLSGCSPLVVEFTSNTVGTDNCLWDFGDGETSSDCSPVTHVYTSEGDFTVTHSVTNIHGCSETHTIPEYIRVTPKPIAMFSANPMETITADPVIDFTNESQNGVNYTWIFGDNSPNAHTFNTSHTYPDSQGGDYIVTLITSNEEGCTDTAELVIRINHELIFYIPNAFTPDNDDYNEVFKPIFTSGFDPYTYTLLIFNRWGETIFESHDINIGWSGTYGEGSGQIVKEGAYIWQIRIKEAKDDKYNSYQGHVNLLR